MADTAKNPQILIVEDDQFLRDLMVQKLHQDGFTFEVAVDGNEAVEKLKTVRPSIILLDLILPGIDGFAVLAKIKANPELAQVPVVVLSNLGAQEDINRAKSLGAADYMVKAYFTLDEIIAKIKKYLSKASI